MYKEFVTELSLQTSEIWGSHDGIDEDGNILGLLRDFRLPPRCKCRYSLSWDVTQRRAVLYCRRCGKPIGLTFKGQAGTHLLRCNSVSTSIQLPTFRRRVLPLLSESSSLRNPWNEGTTLETSVTVCNSTRWKGTETWHLINLFNAQ